MKFFMLNLVWYFLWICELDKNMFVAWIFPYILWNYDVLYLFLSFICCINIHTYGLYLVMTGVSLSPRSCVLVFKLYGYIFVVLFRYWSNSSEFLRTLMELFHFYTRVLIQYSIFQMIYLLTQLIIELNNAEPKEWCIIKISHCLLREAKINVCTFLPNWI